MERESFYFDSLQNATAEDTDTDTVTRDWIVAQLVQWREESMHDFRNEVEKAKEELHLIFQNYCSRGNKMPSSSPKKRNENENENAVELKSDNDSLLSVETYSMNANVDAGRVEGLKMESRFSCTRTEDTKNIRKVTFLSEGDDIEQARNIRGAAGPEGSHDLVSSCFREIDALRQELRAFEHQIQNRGRTMRRSVLSQKISRLPTKQSKKEVHSNTEDASLDNDTFALMMISEPFSQAWLLGLVAFFLQTVLGVMIATEQFQFKLGAFFIKDIPFNVPFVVRVGQLLTIILCVATQHDILTAVRTFIMLGKDSNWDTVIGEGGNRSQSLWMTRIMLPTVLKLIQGIIVVLTCFAIILQSNDIITLLKDFTALMVLSDTDNIFFDLADYGYLGKNLQCKAVAVRETDISQIRNVDEKVATTTPIAIDTGNKILNESDQSSAKEKKGFFVRIVLLIILYTPLIIIWLFAIFNQNFVFQNKYPDCANPGAFKLASVHFGDDECYGGPLNTLECGFEGGDCVNFNFAYPLCKRDYLENVQDEVGNGRCNLTFSIHDCDYDGYDCCDREIVNHLSFGDGHCNGGKISTEGCGYDGGDCSDFHYKYPNCDLDNLAQELGSNNVILGDGVCDSYIYNTESCGYEFGDCYGGHDGQYIALDNIYSPRSSHSRDHNFFFDVRLSLDGSKLVVGFPVSHFVDNITPGVAQVFAFNSTKRMWLNMGDDIKGSQNHQLFGWSVAMNSNSTRIAIGSPNHSNGGSAFHQSGRVEVFDFIEAIDTWVQVGRAIKGGIQTKLGRSIDMTSDGSRLAISAPFGEEDDGSIGEISIWELDESREWVSVGQKIYGKKSNEMIGSDSLHMSSSDGSRIIFNTNHFYTADAATRVYKFDEKEQKWSQIGADIPNPYSGIGKSSAISADGNRIAVSAYSANPDAAGQVQVFDFNPTNNTWDQVGGTIFEPPPRYGINTNSTALWMKGNGFGRNVAMSADGTHLAIAMIDPDCDGNPDVCATGSVYLYRYDSEREKFRIIPGKSSRISRTGVIMAREEKRDSYIFGLHVSFNSDASLISISGYDLDSKQGLVYLYKVDELFYPDCMVYDPYEISDGVCTWIEPYYSAECGFDGGDCPKPRPVKGLPECFVVEPHFIGDGFCIDSPPFNMERCNFDGGDCPVPKPVEGYPGCIVSKPELLGNGFCDKDFPYNTKECMFDGGDCL